MSLVRAYTDQDSWINDSNTASNFGLSPILEVWNKYDIINEKKNWARILVRFSLTSLENQIKNEGLYPDPRTNDSVSAYMYMFNAEHGENQASDFDIWAFPLTASWIEGTGLDNDTYSHTGAVNAEYATNTFKWEDYTGSISGAEAYIGHDTGNYDSNSSSMYFVHGEEDLKLDITSWFKDYLDGTSANNGFLIRMSDAQEAKTDAEATAAGVPTSVTAVSYFTKKFYSRETNTRKRPYFQLEWPGEVKDDRGFIHFSRSGDLYFYNIVDGVYEDLDGANKFPGFVTLSADGVAIEPSNLTASRVSTGVYKINIGTAQDDAENVFGGIDISLSSTVNFTDTWSVTSAGFTTSQVFNFDVSLPNNGNDYVSTSNYHINLPNLRSTYDRGYIGKLRVFSIDKATKFVSSTGSSTAMNSFIFKKGTFEIREKATNMIEVPETPLSYDKDGNYFELNTNNLYPDIEYKVLLKLNTRNETIVMDYPDRWNFKVL